MDTTIPTPTAGRVYRATRRIRLADLDPAGRVRLDAVARLLQDIAIDDVGEVGWGAPDHLWFVRRVRVDVLRPLLEDRTVELATWCSGVSSLAAGRRWTMAGDRGGLLEVDSVWIHLDADARPSRVGDFGDYGLAAAGRKVSTRLTLPPPDGGDTRPWPLRLTDLDTHGHVNNAVHWQIVEELAGAAGLALDGPLTAELDYHEEIDHRARSLDLRFALEGAALGIAIEAEGATKAIARLTAA